MSQASLLHRNPQLAAGLERARQLDLRERHAEALEVLRSLGRSGLAEAMFQLGQRLLVGDRAPFEPQEALRLIEAGVEQGHAGATAQLATLAAAGAWMPQDWQRALDLLQRAAEAGSALARGQLSLLAQTPATAPPGDPAHWRELRERIDLRAWLEPQVERRALSESPRVRLAPGFAPPQLCRWLIHLAHGRLRRAMMYDGSRSRFSAERTNSDYFFDVVGADVTVAVLRQRIAALVKIPVFAMEPPQMLHYAEAEELKAHYDHVGTGGPMRSERIVTFLLYLNEAYQGGETEFCKTGLRVRGRTGDALYFANVDPAGARDAMALHAGLPVLEGEKWLFSQWIRNQTFTG